MKYAEVMATNPPRVRVDYASAEDGSERFTWGIVGGMPGMSLIGAIAGVQSALIQVEPLAFERCDDSSLVLVFLKDAPAGEQFVWFVHPGIPMEPLIGMLEVVKQSLVGAQMAQMAASQSRILAADGGPIRGKPIILG